MPSVGNRGSLTVYANDLAHFFNGRVGRYDIVERQLVLVDDAAHVAATGNLPKDKTQSVDIRTFERIEMIGVDGFVKDLQRSVINNCESSVGKKKETDLGSHVAFGAHSVIERNVDSVHRSVVADC